MGARLLVIMSKFAINPPTPSLWQAPASTHKTKKENQAWHSLERAVEGDHDGFLVVVDACVQARELTGSLFRSLVPISRTDGTEPGDVVLATTNALATSGDPSHPAEADTAPPIPDPPPGGNPARSSVEDAAADAVPIYLAIKLAAYAPAKWGFCYLYMRRHYVDDCLARVMQVGGFWDVRAPPEHPRK